MENFHVHHQWMAYSWRFNISFHKFLLFEAPLPPPKKKKNNRRFQVQTPLLKPPNCAFKILGAQKLAFFSFESFFTLTPLFSLSLSPSLALSPSSLSLSLIFFLSFFLSWEWRASSSLAINLYHLCSASLSSVANRVAATALSSCCHLSLSLCVHKTVVIIITGFVWFIWFGLFWIGLDFFFPFFSLLLLSSGFSLFSATLVFGGFGVRNSGELCSSRRWLITGASSSSSSCLTGKERKGSCVLAAGRKFVLFKGSNCD